MAVETMQYVPFLSENIVNDPSELEAYKKTSDNLLEEYPDEWGASWAKECGTWNSHNIWPNILTENEDFADLTDLIVPKIKVFAQALGMDLDIHDLSLHESWLNAAKPNYFQECHIHDHCYISGVFYINTPENCGDFVMENPLSFEWSFETTDDSPYSGRHYYTPTSGDLIIFPSNISHHVTKNMSDEIRYSLAFNVGISTPEN